MFSDNKIILDDDLMSKGESTIDAEEHSPENIITPLALIGQFRKLTKVQCLHIIEFILDSACLFIR